VRKERLEAFSDGVIAIIITIMVLELKLPHGASLADALSVLPSIGIYAFSFLYVGIYWNNHHHMLHAAGPVTGGVLWANLHLLFWLSLLPLSTRWMIETGFATWPTAVYGFSLLAPGVAYYILSQTLIAVGGPNSLLVRAVGHLDRRRGQRHGNSFVASRRNERTVRLVSGRCRCRGERRTVTY
jgi:uncharacterized membrane protein